MYSMLGICKAKITEITAVFVDFSYTVWVVISEEL